jgi:cold shock CspA family protein
VTARQLVAANESVGPSRLIDLPTPSSESRESGRALMLKAIRNFVRQRSRHDQETQPQVVKNDGMKDLRSHSEVPLQLAEPQLEEPSRQPVWGRVKWYDPDKRYGFVELSDGSGDVFLHATALAGIGVSSLQPGETLEVRVAPGQRGPQVTEVISVDSSTAAPPGPRRKSFRSQSDRWQPRRACRRWGW